MKFWKNNRLDGEFDMPVEDVAAAYLASPYAAEPMPLERKVSLFLSSTDGLSATWDWGDPDLERLFVLIEEGR